MFKRFLPTVIAMLVGLLVLLGYLLPVELLVMLRDFLLSWAAVLAVFAMILAFFSLLRVHLLRLTRMRKNKITSLLVIVSAMGTLALVMWEVWQEVSQGVQGTLTQPLLNWVLIPGESALLALTAVTLIVAGMRIMRTRRTIGGIIFVVAAAIVLLTTVAYSFYPDILAVLRQGVDTLATAGMRGLMLGVALGVTLTGLRVILGFDRPHSDE